MRSILVLLVLSVPAIAQGQAQADPQTDPTSQQATVETEVDAVMVTEAQTPAPLSPPIPLAAEQPAAAPEYQLFDLLASKDQMLDIQQQLVDSLVSANPAMDGYQMIVRDWARQYLSREQLREGMARVYRNYFTAREIEEMIEFYRSPTGRKSVLLMPALFRAGSQLGMELAQAHKAELIDMLRQAEEQKQALSPTPNEFR